MRHSKNSVLVLENVTEYSESLVKKELGPEWNLVSTRIDPRILGLPCSRARVFMICWRVKEVRWAGSFTLNSFVECLRSQVVMNAGSYFFKDLPKTKLTPSAAPCWQELPREHRYVFAVGDADTTVVTIGCSIS